VQIWGGDGVRMPMWKRASADVGRGEPGHDADVGTGRPGPGAEVGGASPVAYSAVQWM
jgi:hypothetical protein